MHMGVLTLEEDAHNPVKVALLPDDGLTGAYFDLNGEASFCVIMLYDRISFTP
jgi:(+)-neomenthol dehydrogenase